MKEIGKIIVMSRVAGTSLPFFAALALLLVMSCVLAALVVLASDIALHVMRIRSSALRTPVLAYLLGLRCRKFGAFDPKSIETVDNRTAVGTFCPVKGRCVRFRVCLGESTSEAIALMRRGMTAMVEGPAVLDDRNGITIEIDKIMFVQGEEKQ